MSVPHSPDYPTSTLNETNNQLKITTVLMIALCILYALPALQAVQELVSTIRENPPHAGAARYATISSSAGVLSQLAYLSLIIFSAVMIRRGNTCRTFAMGVILTRLCNFGAATLAILLEITTHATALPLSEKLRINLPILLIAIISPIALRFLWVLNHPPTGIQPPPPAET